MKQLKAFAAIFPGLALQTVLRWQELFIRTRLAYPNWATEAQNISLATGAFVAVALCIMDANKKAEDVLVRARKLFWATLVGVAGCFIFLFGLGLPIFNTYSAPIQDIWFGCFILTMTFMIGTIAELSLSLSEKNSILFWILTAVAFVIFLGALLIYFFVL